MRVFGKVAPDAPAVRRALGFLLDDTGNATVEYALIAASFALPLLALMTAVQSASAGQLTYIDTSLNNRNGVTP
jgi:Flp pilus assembly pilin Flp